jgi:hypothetical protein
MKLTMSVFEMTTYQLKRLQQLRMSLLHSLRIPMPLCHPPYKTFPEVLFLGDLSPREMLASEIEDAIRQKMDDLRVEIFDSGLDKEGYA